MAGIVSLDASDLGIIEPGEIRQIFGLRKNFSVNSIRLS